MFAGRAVYALAIVGSLSRTAAAPGQGRIFVMATMLFGMVVARHAGHTTVGLEC